MKIVNKGKSVVDVRDNDNMICFEPEEVKDISEENVEAILKANPSLKKVKKEKKSSKKDSGKK